MGKEIIITEANFDEEVLKSQKPVIVDLWAPWCNPCKMYGPIVEEFANDHADSIKVCKINVDENQGIALKYNVASIPTTLVFNKGELINNVVGIQSKEKLKDLIKNL